MARLFDRWFMSPSAEIIALSVGGICSTIMEESVLTIPDRLSEVLIFDYKAYDLKPVVINIVKTAMCLVVLGRRLTAPVYLLSYFLVVWVAFFGKKARLLLPWLFIGFFRHLVLNHVSMLTGAFLGVQQALTWSLLQFMAIKVIELALYAYLWYSVLLLYRGLRLLGQLEEVAMLVKDTTPAAPISPSQPQQPPPQLPPRAVVEEPLVQRVVASVGAAPPADQEASERESRVWRTGGASALLLLAPRSSRSVDEALPSLRDDWDEELELELVGDYKARAMHYLGLRPLDQPPLLPPGPLPRPPAPSQDIVCTELRCDKAVQVNTISRRWLTKLQQQRAPPAAT